jgi:CDP-glycerol glycerophosphotransferase (TagB/SpsB family)
MSPRLISLTASLWRALRSALRVLGEDPRLVVLGAANGKRYVDNSRHLYEWLLSERPDLEPLWLTRSREVFDALKRNGRPVALASSWSGMRALARARVGAYTNSLYDLALSPFLVPEQLQLIALRHGKSVKKVRLAQADQALSSSEQAERRQESSLMRYAISTSEFISDLQEESLRIGRSRHIVTGYPRNDALLDPTDEMRWQWAAYLGDLRPRKVVLYAPTWRHGRGATRFFPFGDFDKSVLVEYLRSRNLLLLLRPHPNDAQAFPAMMALLHQLSIASDLMRVATHDELPNVHSALPFVDVLVTDYSSLYHDFLLLDRPMLFVPYDYEEYNRRNGFHYDYFGNLPGPAVSTMAQFIGGLESILEGQDGYGQQRSRLTKKVHEFRDARSCERVASLIDHILRGEGQD